MKTSKEVFDFLGESEPIRNAVDTIKQSLAFLSIKCGLFSDCPDQKADANISSMFSFLFRLEDYLESSGIISHFDYDQG